MSGNPSYSQFACIGTGFSGIALGCSIKRWYGISDVRFFEKNDDLGGTWLVNQYPGTNASLARFWHCSAVKLTLSRVCL